MMSCPMVADVAADAFIRKLKVGKTFENKRCVEKPELELESDIE